MSAPFDHFQSDPPPAKKPWLKKNLSIIAVLVLMLMGFAGLCAVAGRSGHPTKCLVVQEYKNFQ